MEIPSVVRHADERTPRALAVANSLSVAGSTTGSTKKPGSTKEPGSIQQYRLDLLRPRSTDGRIATQRQRLLRIGSICAATAGAGLFGLWIWQGSLRNDLTELHREQEQLQQFVDRGAEVIDKWSYVSRWRKDTMNAAHEIRDFAALLPARDRMIVTRLQLENVVDSKEGVLRIDGLAQSSEDVLQMNKSILENSARYDLRPQGIEPSPAGSLFPSQFRIEAMFRENGGRENGATENGPTEKDAQ
jgi:hypothetical protein